MFALCGNRTRDLWRSRRVFTPLRHIGRQMINYEKSADVMVRPTPSYRSPLRVSAVNPLVASYDIHERKGEVLFFYFFPGHHTKLQNSKYTINAINMFYFYIILPQILYWCLF
jgi:hypothetical protein